MAGEFFPKLIRMIMSLSLGALAGHGVFDFLHGEILVNSGVPVWWPAFCLAYDLGAAAGLAWLITRGLTTNDARHSAD